MKKWLMAFVFVASLLHAVESVPGVRGNACHIQALYSYLEDPNGSHFELKDGLTIALWLKYDLRHHRDIILNNVGCFSLSNRNQADGGFYFWNNFGTTRNSNMIWAPKAVSKPRGVWFHVAMTYNSQNGMTSIYENGKLKASAKITETNPKLTSFALPFAQKRKSQKFSIGHHSLPIDALFDEVAIYGRELSAEEISHVVKGNFPAGALALYLMDVPGDAGRDSSPNKRHLKEAKGRMSFESLPEIGHEVPANVLGKGNAMTIWSRPAAEKTFRGDRPVASGISAGICAKMARNEAESFQIVATAGKEPLKNVKIELGTLSNGKDSLTPDVCIVEYVAIPVTSKTAVNWKKGTVFGEAATQFEDMRGEGPGWYPDFIRPVSRLDLIPAGKSAAFWVTVRTTAAHSAGIYRGKARVTADGGVSLEVPVSVEVWDFALPEKFHTCNIASSSVRKYGDWRKVFELCGQMHATCILNNCAYGLDIRFDEKGEAHFPTEEMDREIELLLKNGGNCFFLPGTNMYFLPKADGAVNAKWHGVPFSTQLGHLSPEFRKCFGSFLKKMCAHLRQKGWLHLARLALVDEPHSAADFSLCVELANLAHEVEPELNVFVTKWPMASFDNCRINTWCLGMFEHDEMQKVLARGEKLEWYPNWYFLIDRPWMDSRIFGFLMWKYGITGCTYWAIDYGWGNPSALRAPQFNYPDGRIICGSGLLVYPDEKMNPLPSIRFIMSRDAFEDYEYLWLLDSLARKRNNSAALEVIRTSCDSIVPIIKSVKGKTAWEATKWETNPARLYEWREKIANAILANQTASH